MYREFKVAHHNETGILQTRPGDDAHGGSIDRTNVYRIYDKSLAARKTCHTVSALKISPSTSNVKFIAKNCSKVFVRGGEAVLRFQTLGTQPISHKSRFAFPASERHVSHFNTLLYENGTRNAYVTPRQLQ